MPRNALPSTEELNEMHAVYRHGGGEHGRAPQVVYSDAYCPHPGCEQRLQAIDFRVEAYGPAIHDPLVRSWWNDVGFAGQCPTCGGWIHFTIRGKQAVTAEEAAELPQLPADWHANAVVL